MMIPKDLEAEIVRLRLAEKWRINTIATQLDLHHTTVDRVLRDVGVPEAQKEPRTSIADPFIPFIKETLARFPTLSATRIFQMVRDRGYGGTSEGHFRRIVARHRPRRTVEAYLRLRTLPGEQAQVDWGHFGHIEIGRARRQLMAFVMVLSYSRRVFLRFFLNQKLANFLRGHVSAFEAFCGVPRTLLYDNPKTVVLERYGDAIRFHPTLLECAKHYRYEPRPVAVARGNEKGRVERAIRYIRQSFWPARTWKDLEDLNDQAAAWCEGVSSDRKCPEDRRITVREAFEKERDKLLELPDDPFPTHDREQVTVGKTPYVRFDLNDYSVPHTFVRRTLAVVASLSTVRILDGTEVIAEHQRSFGKGDQIEDEAHIEDLKAEKTAARKHRGMDRLYHAAPATHDLLVAAAEHGYNLGSVTANLLRLLDRYGAAELEVAAAEALSRDVPHPQAVRQCLDRRRQERDLPPPLPVPLPEGRLRDLAIRPHDLSTYDIEKENDDDQSMG